MQNQDGRPVGPKCAPPCGGAILPRPCRQTVRSASVFVVDVVVLVEVVVIVGAFVATYLGQALGWYGSNQGAGFIGAVVGAVVVLFVYGLVAGRRPMA